MDTKRYQVCVGNIGVVYSGFNKQLADNGFLAYVELSTCNVGRAGGEPVVMFEDNEIIREFDGSLIQV